MTAAGIFPNAGGGAGRFVLLQAFNAVTLRAGCRSHERF
jgi:hypothetical protein